jgi:putative ABC transport system ATP-binding protein
MTTTTGDVLYDLVGVSRTYKTGGGDVQALVDVDMVIEHGEFIAIEGPSGSGKSTLLQLLGALDKPTAGSLVFDSRDVGKFAEKELTELRSRDIGFIFQAFNLIPTLTAAENVEAVMVPLTKDRAARRKRVAELLERVGLANRAQHLPSLLSGGEQQRVAIARAMANEPRVILADEPTGNLDSTTAEEVVTTLRSLSGDNGTTVIVVTHAEDVAQHARRRIKLRDGHVLTDPRPERSGRLRARPADVADAPEVE